MNTKYLVFSSVVISIGVLTLFAMQSVWTFNSSNSLNDVNDTVTHSANINPGLIGSTIIGSPTNSSITFNTLADAGMEVFIKYGTESGSLNVKSNTATSKLGKPVLIKINGLKPSTRYYYRTNIKKSFQTNFSIGVESSFITQRSNSSTFTFGVQGDSHPERERNMFNSELYSLTMQNVVKVNPDLYFTLGDDFSIEKLIDNEELSQDSVDQVYLLQRQYLDAIGSSSAIFLVNGNHEQAARYLLDGTSNNAAVLAAKARNNFYPLPAPSSFYSGDTEKIEKIGYLKDYYAFNWGDALFVVIDPYWHSETPADNTAGSKDKIDRTDNRKKRNLWNNTLGDTQYQWFKQTLEDSTAKYKFVFTHHILGTGRGGVECAKLCEWGGYNKKGSYDFDKMRPTWDMPIHNLMAKNHVTIFFQGHDHLFAKQELDGVIYQEVPNPADNTYTAFNEKAYKQGDTLPNSGFIKVIVSPRQVKVDYIRSFLPEDEDGEKRNGSIAYSYVLKGV